jgi:hypothetical protein
MNEDLMMALLSLMPILLPLALYILVRITTKTQGSTPTSRANVDEIYVAESRWLAWQNYIKNNAGFNRGPGGEHRTVERDTYIKH